jgi:hypothetical protein
VLRWVELEELTVIQISTRRIDLVLVKMQTRTTRFAWCQMFYTHNWCSLWSCANVSCSTESDRREEDSEFA